MLLRPSSTSHQHHIHVTAVQHHAHKEQPLRTLAATWVVQDGVLPPTLLVNMQAAASIPAVPAVPPAPCIPQSSHNQMHTQPPEARTNVLALAVTLMAGAVCGILCGWVMGRCQDHTWSSETMLEECTPTPQHQVCCAVVATTKSAHRPRNPRHHRRRFQLERLQVPGATCRLRCTLRAPLQTPLFLCLPLRAHLRATHRGGRVCGDAQARGASFDSRRSSAAFHRVCSVTQHTRTQQPATRS